MVLKEQEDHRSHKGGTDDRQDGGGCLDDGGQSQVADGTANHAENHDTGAVGETAVGDPLEIGGSGSEQANGGGQAGETHHDGQDDHAEAAQKLMGDGDDQTGLVQSLVQKHTSSGAQIGQTAVYQRQQEPGHTGSPGYMAALLGPSPQAGLGQGIFG